MQMVIEIPNDFQFCVEEGFLNTYDIARICRSAIENGTPLPEHHGILKDTSKLDVLSWQGKSDEFTEGVTWAMEQLDSLPTIIPATKDCKTCAYQDETSGEICYECVKGMNNNYTPVTEEGAE